MNKNKLGKVTGVGTAAFLLAGTTAFTAFAAMPSGTAVIGDKAYDLNYVNDPANVDEIVAAMQAANYKVYVKDFAGTWIDNATEAEITDLAVIPAVEYKNAKGEVTNYDAKDGEEAEAPAEDGDLEVVSVKALNLRQVAVEFGTKVDEDSAEDVDNYELNNDAEVAKAILQEDGKTVILYLQETSTTGIDNQKEYELTIEDVQDLNENELEKTEKTFTAFDAELPTVEAVEVVGPRDLKLKISEPINKASFGDFKATITNKETGKTYSGSSVTINEDEDELTFRVSRELEDGVDYSVKLQGVEDWAGYQVKVEEVDFTYEEVNDAPTATIVEADPEYVRVKFNRPVKGLNTGDFYHSFSSWNAIGVYSDSDMTQPVVQSNFYDEVWVKFYDDGSSDEHALPSGTVKFVIDSDDDNDQEIVDRWDNELPKVEEYVEVEADKEKPAVKSVEFDTKNNKTVMTIKFSEDVTGVTAGNVKVYDEDGDDIDIDISAVDADEYDVILDDNYENSEITLKLEDIKDTSLEENEIEPYSEKFTIDDITDPKLNNVTLSNGYVRFEFSEELDSDTALDVKNYLYSLGGSSYEEFENDPEFVSGSNDKIVEIKLTDDEADDFAGATGPISVLVKNVEDLSEKEMTATTTTIAAPAANRGIDTLELTASDEIEITFDTELVEFDSNAFKVTKGGEAVDVDIDDTVNSDGYTVVTISLNSDDDSFGTAVGVGTGYKLEIDGSKLEDALGTTVSAITIADITNDAITEDEAAPEVYSHIWANDPVTTKGVITVNFTEALDPDSVSKYTFDVDNYDVEKVEFVDADTLKITLDDDIATGETVTFRFKNPVADAAGNEQETTDDFDVKSTLTEE